ncbi:MAG: hypothetical protein A2Y41_08700 [Spirochaetes bacterium GWB1_36_13]|nr:MAG: hypothetical protein A2Y41_08700 [Spirochaetes bacterium GWB1_36_13]
MKFLLDENFPKKAIYTEIILNCEKTKSFCHSREGGNLLTISVLSSRFRSFASKNRNDKFCNLNSFVYTCKFIGKLNWFLKQFQSDVLENKCILINDNRCKVYS